MPEPTDEAIRDLCRARTDAVDDRNRARHRLKSFLLRHGYRYSGHAAWGAAHMRYLRELVLAHPAMKVIMEDYLCAIDAAQKRVARCEKGMQELLENWQLRPAVKALMAFNGFQVVAAMIVVSELGFVPRFAHPRKLMAYLGLVPTRAPLRLAASARPAALLARADPAGRTARPAPRRPEPPPLHLRCPRCAASTLQIVGRLPRPPP